MEIIGDLIFKGLVIFTMLLCLGIFVLITILFNNNDFPTISARKQRPKK